MSKYLLLLLALVSCSKPTGGTIIFPAPKPGPSGLPGPQGPVGPQGDGCTVTSIAKGDTVLPQGGSVIVCGKTSSLISSGQDGLNGNNGLDAPQTYAILNLVNPCGDASNISDEVFLKLADGTILWLQVDNAAGLNARLSVALPGNWITTDGDNCSFTLNSDGTITNESHHSQ